MGQVCNCSNSPKVTNVDAKFELESQNQFKMHNKSIHQSKILKDAQDSNELNEHIKAQHEQNEPYPHSPDSTSISPSPSRHHLSHSSSILFEPAGDISDNNQKQNKMHLYISNNTVDVENNPSPDLTQTVITGGNDENTQKNINQDELFQTTVILHSNKLVTSLQVNDASAQSSSDERKLQTISSTRCVQKSKRIINEYQGNNNIQILRQQYMKQYKLKQNKSIAKKEHKKHDKFQKKLIKREKSTHSVQRSSNIINEYKGNNNIKQLKKRHKKLKKKTKKLKKGNDILINVRKRSKSTHSVQRSSDIIAEYKGNNDISILKKGYMKQYEKEIKLIQNPTQCVIIPPKPKNIDNYMNDETNILYSELFKYITSNTHYIGMIEFPNNLELCIEIEFISCNNGIICGKRTLINFNDLNSSKIIKLNGNGKIYKDLLWNVNKSKYEYCVKFEWIDVNPNNKTTTKLIFNTIEGDMDIDNLYFEGKCYQYTSNQNQSINNNDNINVNEGSFNMVCVSMRTRDCLKRNALLNYHKIDIWSMDDDELKNVPKYIKCMNITSVKMQKTLLKKSKSKRGGNLFVSW